jgi:hypothetical protein
MAGRERAGLRVSQRFALLVHPMPAKPTAGRTAVWWNQLKTGAVYVQDSACATLDTTAQRREPAPVLERIDADGGRDHLLPLRQLPSDEEARLRAPISEQSATHYRDIIENCDGNVGKEIEFEHFRHNDTYAEAEEIRMEFDRIRAWNSRIEARDRFDAPNRDEARGRLPRCGSLLEELKVFERNATDAGEPGNGLRLLPEEESSSARARRAEK